MRVGLVCPYPWDVPGGVMAHVRDLGESLTELGHDVAVLAPVVDSDGPLPEYLTDAGRPLPIPYNGSVARLLFGPVSFARVRRWLRAGIDGDGFDVLHVHEPTAPSVALLAAYAATGPIVATFHTSNTRSRLLSAAEPLLTPALEKVAARIAVSPAARRTVVDHLGGDCVEIPNGVAVARYVEAAPATQYGDGPVVAFVGRVDESRKGLAVLLAAWPRIREAVADARLVVAGPGEPPEEAEGLDGVTLLGLISEEDKAALLRRADVFCAPNLGGESFGIVLLEAMAAGAPVVASNLDAFRRVLADGRAGLLVPTDDRPALADAVIGLLGDPAARADLVTRGTARAAEFDWRSVARQVLTVYDTVAPSAGHPVVTLDPTAAAEPSELEPAD
ncbi:MAG TPA: glycosyltransferase family 4 protein [Mycobacteriales bacterium]|nr:glycosyltransferase family 4 protein [Mycobacteriales bacterium]